MRKAWAVALALLATHACTHAREFTDTLPDGLPSMSGWEKVTGDVDLDSPRARVRYEFFVNPVRSGLYEVIRYRFSLTSERRRASEKLQWHVAFRNLRRWECAEAERSGDPCHWRELAVGSPEYDHERDVILTIYALHRRLLWERANVLSDRK